MTWWLKCAVARKAINPPMRFRCVLVDKKTSHPVDGTKVWFRRIPGGPSYFKCGYSYMPSTVAPPLFADSKIASIMRIESLSSLGVTFGSASPLQAAIRLS